MTGDEAQTTSPSEGQSQTEAQAGGSVEESRFSIRMQYLKDISFENPNAPMVYAMMGEQPDIAVSMDVHARTIDEPTYEVILSAHVEAKIEDSPAFIVELQYAALVTLAADVAGSDLEPLLLVEVPRLLFPFVRDLVATATREGGFPPLLINPIDFSKLYTQQQTQRRSTAEATAQPQAG